MFFGRSEKPLTYSWQEDPSPSQKRKKKQEAKGRRGCWNKNRKSIAGFESEVNHCRHLLSQTQLSHYLPQWDRVQTQIVTIWAPFTHRPTLILYLVTIILCNMYLNMHRMSEKQSSTNLFELISYLKHTHRYTHQMLKTHSDSNQHMNALSLPSPSSSLQGKLKLALFFTPYSASLGQSTASLPLPWWCCVHFALCTQRQDFHRGGM